MSLDEERAVLGARSDDVGLRLGPRLHGGDARAASWQNVSILSCILFAFTLAATFRTSADYGLWRSGSSPPPSIAIGMHGSVFTGELQRRRGEPDLTTYDDTIGWVVCILILIVERDRQAVVVDDVPGNLVLSSIFSGCHSVQQPTPRVGLARDGAPRRLFPLPSRQGQTSRQPRGGGSSANLGALHRDRMGTIESDFFAPALLCDGLDSGRCVDPRAKRRKPGPPCHGQRLRLLFGYRLGTALYLPHSQVRYFWFRAVAIRSAQQHLGLLAFTGVVGFAGFWLAIPTAIFLNARVARIAVDPTAKHVGIIGAAPVGRVREPALWRHGAIYFQVDVRDWHKLRDSLTSPARRGSLERAKQGTDARAMRRQARAVR